jgi:hypothetical protein
MMLRIWLMVLLTLLLSPAGARALEHVVLKLKGEEIAVSGRLLFDQEEIGMFLLSDDGTLWSVHPEDLVSRKHDDEPMTPLSPEEMGERLRKELPGFEVHLTQHYVICYNTSRVYAQWCGALFERLYKAFTNFWQRKDFELHDPEFPLVAVVFADQASYVAYAGKELGDGAKSTPGYYSLRTNRMTLYDLTGVQKLRRAGDKRASAAQVNQMLARPEAERLVATIVHEATHQIAYSCGLQTRHADIPVWFNEGMATYFETPDLASSKGWRTIGAVNQVQFAGFREYLRKQRPADSLVTLLASDDRLRDPERKADAYGESWALTYFLIRQRPKQYMAYVKMLSEKKQLVVDDAETRLREFQQAFGDLNQLDADFVRQMEKVK